jgi:hypothetical protein
MSRKLQKTYSVVREETKVEWKISEKSVMRVGKDDFLILTPRVYGLVRVLCDCKIDIQRIQRPTFANTDGYNELVELRNEAQRAALEPEEKRARRAALAKMFGDGKKRIARAKGSLERAVARATPSPSSLMTLMLSWWPHFALTGRRESSATRI